MIAAGAVNGNRRRALPAWLDGKVDTHHISAGRGRVAIADGAGTLWLSEEGSRGWRALATDLSPVDRVQVL